MKKFWQNPLIRLLASLKTAAVLMAVVAFATGWATFYESRWGRDGAYDVVYAARWFEVILVLLLVNMMLLLFKRMPYRGRQTGFVMVHVAMIVILIGAGITRYFGYEGLMRIREGAESNFIYSAQNYVQASAMGRTARYPLRLYRPGEQDHAQTVRLAGREFRLGVSEFWPRFEENYVADESGAGPAALQYGVTGPNGVRVETIVAGDRVAIAGVDAIFHTDALPPAEDASRYGFLRIRANDEICRFPVTPPPAAPVACGGHTFEIVEFQSDFKVGGESDPEGPLLNPMIRLAITGPDGRRGERLLFAFHPDFAMNHDQDGGFASVDLAYSVSRGLALAPGGATGIVARAGFELTVMDMSDPGAQVVIPAGETFDLEVQKLYGSADGEFTFVPAEVFASVKRAPTLSENENAPAAARVYVEDGAGNRADAVVVRGGRETPVVLGDQELSLAYGPVVKELPYRLELEDFRLETYPGSDNPASYESWVRLYDAEQGIEGEQVRIWMNHPLNHRGTKHFQSSYDQDRRGTVLSVNFDPGKWPTYLGYTLIALGFLLILARDLIWPQKRPEAETGATQDERSRAVLVTIVAVVTVLGGLGMGSVRAQTSQGTVPDDDVHAQAQEQAQAQNDPHAGHEHAAHAPGQPPAFTELPGPLREQTRRLAVQDWRGRMKPLDTLAVEMMLKITKKHRFEGYDPVDLFLNWMANPEFWFRYPIIAVRYEGLKDLLGVPPSTTHVSAESLFDENGRYRLASVVEEAHRTPDIDRSKTQRKLISFDERFNLFYLALRGEILRIFPVPNDPNHTWQDIQKVLNALGDAPPASDYRAAFFDLREGLRTGDTASVGHGIAAIETFQEDYGGKVALAGASLWAELQLNRLQPFVWVTIPYVIAFVLLQIAFNWNLFRREGRPYTLRHPLYALGMLVFVGSVAYHFYAYVLRWIASGRAPLSNGYESLIFIALMVAIAGLVFESRSREGVSAGLASLLTTVILGTAMLSTFNPDIGPLVPVLASYWLNIHVTVITGSYAFLGLSAALGAQTLLLYLAKGPGRATVHAAIHRLDRLNTNVMVTGLAFLTIGTLLGGVWANESWGRYWGWDPKETWSFVTILVYAVILHFRFIPALRSAWLHASLSTAAIASVVMTYFGVNYFLSGLHSYAAGDAAKVPSWVPIGVLIVAALIALSYAVKSRRDWQPAG